MKRLFALIFAVLLPCTAAAETWCADMTLEVNETYCAELLTTSLTELLGEDASENSATFAAAAAKLLNGFGIHVRAQEDAASFELELNGKSFLDFTFHSETEKLVITSDLMKGYAVTIPVEEQASADEAPCADWVQMLTEALNAGMLNISGIEGTRAQGAFSGDAYTGGVYCDTYVFDDSDVAGFLGSMTTPELRSAATELLHAAGLDASSLLAQWDSLHVQTADANAHTYLLRMVRDAELQPIGISLTVMRGEAQLATLSCGMDEDTVRLVLGKGDGDKNYWYDHAVQSVSGEGLHLKGVCAQFTGKKDEAFAYAAAVSSEPLSLITWELSGASSEQLLSWRYEHAVSGSLYALPQRIVSTGEQNVADGSFCSTTTFFVNDRETAKLLLSAALCQSIATPATDLIVCDLNSTEEKQLLLRSEISSMMMQILTARVISIIPMELLTILPGILQ